LGILSEPKPDVQSIIQTLQRLALTTKQKDATGLGVMAYELSQGDTTVLQGNGTDHPIQVIADAIKAPAHFWDSITRQTANKMSLTYVEQARNAHQVGGKPKDLAFMQAAALLSTTGEIPAVSLKQELECPESDFPIWIVIDNHTDAGKEHIKALSGQTHLSTELISHLLFYFEGSIENEMAYSYWWDRQVNWRLNKLGVNISEAVATWESIKPCYLELVADTESQLRQHIDSMQAYPSRLS
jgi:hypothetical protein